MAITFTSGLEPQKHGNKEFDVVKESERRAAEFLQSTDGFVNPLETQITFPTGVAGYTITSAGSGYLSSPTVTFVNRSSFSGSGATATTSITIPAGTVKVSSGVVWLWLFSWELLLCHRLMKERSY